MSNFNINKLILAGRITKDIEVRRISTGSTVCNFVVAVKRKSKRDMEPQSDFFRCQAWNRTADFISQYFKKGAAICVVGSIQNRDWTDENGTKRYQTEMYVEEAMFVDSRSEMEQEPTESYIPEAYTNPPEPNKDGLETDDDLPF